MNFDLVFASPGAVPPTLSKPFAVLLDADDRDWVDDTTLVRSVKALLRAGCRYFVCFGSNSEHVHDRIDDLVIDGGFDGTVTTWHDDESEEEVAEFFAHSVTSRMKSAVVLVRDQNRWSVTFSKIE